MSSPGTYSRCCTNSTECPKNGLRCMPEMKPSTTWRARRSSREMRAIVSGWRKRRGSSAVAATGWGLSRGMDGELVRVHRVLVADFPRQLLFDHSLIAIEADVLVSRLVAQHTQPSTEHPQE